MIALQTVRKIIRVTIICFTFMIVKRFDLQRMNTSASGFRGKRLVFPSILNDTTCCSKLWIAELMTISILFLLITEIKLLAGIVLMDLICGCQNYSCIFY